METLPAAGDQLTADSRSPVVHETEIDALTAHDGRLGEMGRRLRELTLGLGCLQETLAEKVGVSVATKISTTTGETLARRSPVRKLRPRRPLRHRAQPWNLRGRSWNLWHHA